VGSENDGAGDEGEDGDDDDDDDDKEDSDGEEEDEDEYEERDELEDVMGWTRSKYVVLESFFIFLTFFSRAMAVLTFCARIENLPSMLPL
jgi:hypothetical protein